MKISERIKAIGEVRDGYELRVIFGRELQRVIHCPSHCAMSREPWTVMYIYTTIPSAQEMEYLDKEAADFEAQEKFLHIPRIVPTTKYWLFPPGMSLCPGYRGYKKR